MTELEELKQSMRAELRARRTMLSHRPDWPARCGAMCRRLLESPLWTAAERVVLFISVKGEPDTSLLLREAWRSGRTVFLPRCRPGEPGIMDMIACDGPDGLVPSAFGIPEPRLHPGSRLLTSGELRAGGATLVVAPAIAFDRQGYRIGYGGGFYDRMFSRARCASAGLAPAPLLVDSLPHDGLDMPVGAVCTERELLHTGHEQDETLQRLPRT